MKESQREKCTIWKTLKLYYASPDYTLSIHYLFKNGNRTTTE